MLRKGQVVFRAVEPEDLDLMYLVENDTELWQYGLANVPFSRFSLKQFIEQTSNDFYSDRQVRFAVEDGNGEVVGFVDLQNANIHQARAEVGIVVLPAFQRQGYGRIMLDVVSEYARKHLRLHQLYALVSENNISAMSLFEKADYKKTATLRHWMFHDEKWQDVIMFQKIL